MGKFQQAIEAIPFSAKMLLGASGWLIGANYQSLPQYLQTVGLWAGIVMFAIAALAIGAHLFWHFRGSTSYQIYDYFFGHCSNPCEVASETPKPNPRGLRIARGQKASFDDLLMFEFQNDVKIGSELIQTGPLATVCYANFITAQDLRKRVSYNIVHIPKNANAEQALCTISAQLAALRGNHTSPIVRKYGDDEPIVGESLAYSDQLFVFHEAKLTDVQKEAVWNMFKDQGIITVFRGPEYIADMWKKYGPEED